MLRKITLKNSVLSRLKAPISQFKKNEIEDSVKSFTPGEWVIIQDSHLGFINPLVEDRFNSLRVVSTNVSLEPIHFIKEKIIKAISYRNQWNGYEPGSRRLFFGEQDGLPGLIIDQYQNINIVQINSAGVDKYRDDIKKILEAETQLPVYLLDNEASRKKEFLAIYNEKSPVEKINIVENGFSYQIDINQIQKLGYYYDHRENRLLLESILKRWNVKIDKGLDLFSYLGSWSKHALRAGVNSMELIDQGDLENKIHESFKIDGMQSRYLFQRGDVFKILDIKAQNLEKYKLIISDPPAFAKSSAQKNAAIDGYQKLHQKILKIIESSAIVVCASCTHYVNNSEFLTSMREAAKKEKKKIKLLNIGHQGFDHPTSGDGDSSHYIKSYIFHVENL